MNALWLSPAATAAHLPFLLVSSALSRLFSDSTEIFASSAAAFTVRELHY